MMTYLRARTRSARTTYVEAMTWSVVSGCVCAMQRVYTTDAHVASQTQLITAYVGRVT